MSRYHRPIDFERFVCVPRARIVFRTVGTKNHGYDARNKKETLARPGFDPGPSCALAQACYHYINMSIVEMSLLQAHYKVTLGARWKPGKAHGLELRVLPQA